MLNPRDREALLDAGSRLLFEGLGARNALEFLRLIGEGGDQFEEIRRQLAYLSADEALDEMSRQRRMMQKEEDDMSAAIRAWADDYLQKLRAEERQKGRKEGRNEGRKEGALHLLLRLLRARFGEVPAATVARIEAADVAELERWGERVLSAKTLADVLDDPS